MEIYPVFSSRVEFLLGICHILNLMTTIVLRSALYSWIDVFLWVRPPPFKHPIWLWPFPKGHKNMKTAYFPALATSPSLWKKWKKDIKWSLTWITWGPLFHEYLTLVVLMGRDSTVGSDSQVMRFNLWMNGHRAWWCEACQCHLDENWTPRSEMRLSN